MCVGSWGRSRPTAADMGTLGRGQGCPCPWCDRARQRDEPRFWQMAVGVAQSKNECRRVIVLILAMPVANLAYVCERECEGRGGRAHTGEMGSPLFGGARWLGRWVLCVLVQPYVPSCVRGMMSIVDWHKRGNRQLKKNVGSADMLVGP